MARLLLPSPIVHRVVEDEELLEARPTSCLQSSTAILGRAAGSRRRRRPAASLQPRRADAEAPTKPGLCVKVLILGETQGPPCGTNVVDTNV